MELLLLDFELDDDPRPLDLPPIPPGLEDVERRTIDPFVEVEVFGGTTEPVTGLFWKAPLE